MGISSKIALSVLLVLTVGLIAFAVTSEIQSRQREKTYAEAHALYKEGKFEEAAEIYSKLKDENWLRNCDRSIAERDAQALYDEGKLEEAVNLLRERSPESENLADWEKLSTQIAEEQEFGMLSAEGAWEEAKACLDRITELNRDTGRLQDSALEAMRYITEGKYSGWRDADSRIGSGGNEYVKSILAEVFAANGYYEKAVANYKEIGDEEGIRATLAVMESKGEHDMGTFKVFQMLGDEEGMRKEAEGMLASGLYDKAYEAYGILEDRDGMRAVIEAQASSGKTAQALDKMINIGDYEQAEYLLDHMPAESSLLSDNYSESSLVCGNSLSVLMERGDDAALELASRMVDQVAEECRASIAEEHRSTPYYALSEVKERAEALWTEELEALRRDCVREMPQISRIFRDTGLERKQGSLGANATVTVHNKSKRAFILSLWQIPDACIYVFVSPGDYKFTVAAGNYEISVIWGDLWFGEKEGFGPRTTYTEVKVNNGMRTIEKGERLEGSYYLTVE